MGLTPRRRKGLLWILPSTSSTVNECGHSPVAIAKTNITTDRYVRERKHFHDARLPPAILHASDPGRSQLDRMEAHQRKRQWTNTSKPRRPQEAGLIEHLKIGSSPTRLTAAAVTA